MEYLLSIISHIAFAVCICAYIIQHKRIQTPNTIGPNKQFEHIDVRHSILLLLSNANEKRN